MKISAVMALYNTPYNYLEKTIKSILNQTFKDFELIIVDDCSSTEYQEFLTNFNDTRIKYHKLEKNSGPSHARNVGINMSNGEYIAICDSDDVYEETRFENQINYLNSHPNISILGGAYKFSNNLNKIIKPIINNEDLKIELLFNSPFANPIMMIKKQVISDYNLYFPQNMNFAEDYYIWVNAMFKNCEMANIEEVLMTYTRRKGQLSKQASEKQKTSLKTIYKLIFEKLNIDFNSQDVENYYKIATKNYKNIQKNDLEHFINKIVEANNNQNIFNADKLKNKLEKIKNEFFTTNNRIFKLKIGSKNLCIYKPFKIIFENRA